MSAHGAGEAVAHFWGLGDVCCWVGDVLCVRPWVPEFLMSDSVLSGLCVLVWRNEMGVRLLRCRWIVGGIRGLAGTAGTEYK